MSLGWGVAAYSQALRLVRADKGRLSWAGLVLQTCWRVSMLTARVAALVLLCLALGHWALIVLGRCHLAIPSHSHLQLSVSVLIRPVIKAHSCPRRRQFSNVFFLVLIRGKRLHLKLDLMFWLRHDLEKE